MNNNVSELLAELRTMAAQAAMRPGDKPGLGEGLDFAAAIKTSINEVNASQQRANRLTEAFEVGDPKVDLSQVMIEMQKARVSFEALTQVRNKFIEAYHAIMNMSV
jgi:flagellar hook-basal body complex protein FliE